MKPETKSRLLSDFWSWLLAMAITVGAMGCMISGLYLEPDSWFGFLLLWGGVAFLCCLCARLRRGWLILLTVATLAVWLLLADGTLQNHVEALVYQISYIYDLAYKCGTLGDPLNPHLYDMALGLIGCLCAAVCSACLCAGTGTGVCVLMGFLPLSTCLVVLDTPPDAGWLILLLTAFVVVLVTAAVRRRDAKEGRRLAALVLIPAVLFVSLTVQFGPGTDLNGALRGTVLSWFERLAGSTGAGIIVSGNPLYTEITDLTALGPQIRRYYPVMDISSTYSGAVYLRGQAYDSYDGTSWSASYVASYANLEWPSAEGRYEIGQISISTRDTLPMRYFPYYPAGLWWFSEFGRGHMANPDSLKEYTFRVTELNEQFYADKHQNELPPPADALSGSASLILAPSPSYNQHLQLPEYTLLAARAYLDGHDLPAKTSQRELAQAICKLVSESAQYSLDTPKMPADERDFAIWFLRESDTGYCVHFATAAVVLLRASGIEARYVTGYAQTVQAGATVPVNAHHAHAWVEYFDTAAGCWRYLDPTPATAGSTNPNAGTNTDDPQPSDDPTKPPETEPVETSPGSAPTDGNDTPSTDTTLPSATTGGAQPPDQVSVTPKGGWLWLILPLALAVLAAAQYFLRLLWYRRRLRHGKPNAQALLHWRHACRYALALKRRPPKDILELAEKARFSQHDLTEQELLQFAQHLTDAREALKARPFPIRIFWLLVLAIE